MVCGTFPDFCHWNHRIQWVRASSADPKVVPLFHIGKDRVDLDSFAAFLTQPDTVEFAHDGITIDSRAPFTRESWLFTHQITSYGAWTFLPLALRLTMHSARFELTLALRQEEA